MSGARKVAVLGIALAMLLALGALAARRGLAPHAIRIGELPPRDVELVLQLDGVVTPFERVRDGLRATTTGEPRVDAFVRTSCGLEPLALRRIDTYGESALWVPEHAPMLRRVLVDDRSSHGHTLRVGALVVRPRGLGVATIAVGSTCPDAARVRVDEDDVGVVPDDGLGTDLLVDVAGTHCYALRDDDREIVVLTQLDATAPSTLVETLRPARAHALAHVDFAFEGVPDRVDLDALGRTTDGAGHVRLRSLAAIDCDAPP